MIAPLVRMTRVEERWWLRRLRHDQDKLESAEEKARWDRVLLYDAAIDKIVNEWDDARREALARTRGGGQANE